MGESQNKPVKLHDPKDSTENCSFSCQPNYFVKSFQYFFKKKDIKKLQIITSKMLTVLPVRMLNDYIPRDRKSIIQCDQNRLRVTTCISP